jgi:hypothetical protein
MTEMNGNPIFWDRESSKPQPRFIARVEEPEMLVSLRQVLKKYLVSPKLRKLSITVFTVIISLNPKNFK